jgi:hypothetical protein
MFDFRFNTYSYFPESGLRKHFQNSGMHAIDSPHEITPRYDFEGKISKIFDFRFNTHIYFPESGKRFQASGMRAIDSSHKISPNRVIFEKKFGSKKHEKITQIPVFYTPCK